MQRNLLRQYLSGLLGGNHDAGVDHGAVEVAGHGDLHYIQRLVTADEDYAAHHCGSGVVGMVAAGSEVLAFHCDLHHFLLGEGTAVEFVHAVCCCGAGCGAGADTAAGIYLLADSYVDLGLLADSFEKCAHHRCYHVLLDIVGKRNVGLVCYGQAVSFTLNNFNDVSNLIKGQTDDVKTAAHVGDGRRCKNAYFSHIISIRY